MCRFSTQKGERVGIVLDLLLHADSGGVPSHSLNRKRWNTHVMGNVRAGHPSLNLLTFNKQRCSDIHENIILLYPSIR